LRATKTVVQNLRRDDLFSLASFDDTAHLIVPTGPITAKQVVLGGIDAIASRIKASPDLHRSASGYRFNRTSLIVLRYRQVTSKSIAVK
jgi:hypothetical protein